MKKTLLMSMLLLSIPTSSFAFDVKEILDDNLSQSTQENLIPCAAAFLAPMVLGSEDYMSIGSSVCAGVMSYNYIKNDLNYGEVKSFEKDIEKFLKQAKIDIQKNNEKMVENYAYYQEIIKDTVGQKFAEFDIEIKNSIKDHLNSPEFKQRLENKLNNAKISKRLSSREKMIIKEEITKEVLDMLR